jgi:hypothetical protein
MPNSAKGQSGPIAARSWFFAGFWLVRPSPGSRLGHAYKGKRLPERGKPMFIGLGTIVLIVIIVLVVWMLRR